MLLSALCILALFGQLTQGRGANLVLNFSCTQLTVTVNVSTNATNISLDPPVNQTQLTGLVQESFSATSNVSKLEIGSVPLVASYDIFAELCAPNGFSSNGSGVLELAIHGLNLDHTYWTIDGPGSPLNYVESSIAAGNAIFIFDRLGTGRSSTPDGIKEVQTSVHVAVVQSLIDFLRPGVLGFDFKSIVGVGHSYGSFILASLVANHGDIIDALVLTGFSTNTQGESAVNAGLAFAIASQTNSTKFGSLSNSYMASSNIINVQQDFLHFPNFPQSALEFMNDNKGINTLGELITRGDSLTKIAANYTKPVLIVTGDKDVVECAGNCFQSVNGSANILEPARDFFPNASNFTTFIPAHTGHCINAHFSAPEAYSVIHDWIATQVVGS